jgi:dihydrofolate reductase
MRKLVVLTFVSLDGVMQAPGGPDEDVSGGFELGGWTVPFADDVMGETMAKQMGQPFDLLLGRKTFDIFAGYWPQHNNEVGKPINKATKGVRPATWKLTESVVTPSGVIVASYARGGEVKTGSFD